MRVQPHLKKCFEGIAKLEFTEQQEIIGMISSENEIVPLSQKILPAKAKVSNIGGLNGIIHYLEHYKFTI